MLYFGQIVYGIGIGFSMHAAPVYVAGMCPESIRGALVSLKELFIAWLLISEIFPLRHRSKAFSIATFVNFGSNLLVALTFLSLNDAFGQSGCFFMYTAIAGVAFVFIYFKVPETKGKTLE